MHKFLDIEVIIKRTLVFAGLFAMVMAVVGSVSVVTQNLLGAYFRMPMMVSMALSVAIALILYEPVKKSLMEVTDKYLFQKKQDIRVILNKLSREVVAILDLEKVSRTILNTLHEMFRLKAGALLIKDENDKGYQCLHAFGLDLKEPFFDASVPFISYLAGSREVINLEDPHVKAGIPREVAAGLQAFGAAVVIPLVFQDELIGILMLGPKISDQEFSRDEIDFLPTLAGQAALAVRNARSHETTLKNRVEFAQQAKLAALGTLLGAIGHEIKNHINNTLGLASVFLMNEERKVYEKNTREELMQEFRQLMVMIRDNTERSHGVVKRLSSFVRKPKEFKVEKVSPAEALEGAAAMVKSELQNNNIRLEMKLDGSLPFILADLHALEEVFLNLLVNARHAVKSGGTITAGGRVNQKEVEVFIQDTGCGISEENLAKIFEPFFTTKDTSRNEEGPETIKGTGLGLHLVREIVKQYGGRVTVDSVVGAGTTFHVFFPVPVESVKNVPTG